MRALRAEKQNIINYPTEKVFRLNLPEESDMMWFNGSIASAVDKVKSSNALLLVFVKGDDYMSSVYEKVLNDENNFKANNYVAIQILHNSVAFEQFQQIYVAVPVPSVFILEPNGIPSSIISSHDMQEFTGSLKEAVQKHSKENHGHPDNQNGEIPMSKARIQFRFPSNEIRLWEFPSMCTLRDVKLFLIKTIKLGPRFKLHRICPRTAFTPQDEDKTLTDLSLVPNATLIVVPLPDDSLYTKLKKMLVNKSLISSFVVALIQPVLSFVSYFRRRFMVKAPEDEKSDSVKAREINSKRFSKKISSSNVHGFAFDESDTDSDMNTDNGNSTQQK